MAILNTKSFLVNVFISHFDADFIGRMEILDKKLQLTFGPYGSTIVEKNTSHSFKPVQVLTDPNLEKYTISEQRNSTLIVETVLDFETSDEVDLLEFWLDYIDDLNKKGKIFTIKLPKKKHCYFPFARLL